MISADVFFIAVETSLPLGRAVSYLSAIGESLDFILFEMSETMSFFCRKVFNNYASSNSSNAS
jgi:hypothetical protein